MYIVLACKCTRYTYIYIVLYYSAYPVSVGKTYIHNNNNNMDRPEIAGYNFHGQFNILFSGRNAELMDEPRDK